MPTLKIEGVGSIKIPDDVPKEAYDAIVKDAVAQRGGSFSSPRGAGLSKRLGGKTPDQPVPSAVPELPMGSQRMTEKELGTGLAKMLPAAGAAAVAAAGAPATLGGMALYGAIGGAGGAGWGQTIEALLGDPKRSTKDAIMELGEGALKGAAQEVLPGAVVAAPKAVSRLSSAATEKLLQSSLLKSDAGKRLMEKFEGTIYTALKDKLKIGGPPKEVDLTPVWQKFNNAIRGSKNAADKKALGEFENAVFKPSAYGTPSASARLDDLIDLQGRMSQAAYKGGGEMTQAGRSAFKDAVDELRGAITKSLSKEDAALFEKAKAANQARISHDTRVQFARTISQALVRRATFGGMGAIYGGYSGGWKGAAEGAVAGVVFDKLAEKSAPYLYQRLIVNPTTKKMFEQALILQQKGKVSEATELGLKAAAKADASANLRRFYRDMATGSVMQAVMGPEQTQGQTP